MILGKYSIGIGDRFGHQGKAQLRALSAAAADGVDIVPVWNKSHREHTIIKTSPAEVRAEADEAVAAGGWKGTYHVDADHIGMKNVALFLESSDFFTLDVADFIGEPASADDVEAFVGRHGDLVGDVRVPGIDEVLHVTREQVVDIGGRFLRAVQEAGRIYRHIAAAKGAGAFITEVSMDESEAPQTPVEMLFILAAIADEGIPAQTIAPKFTGRFNKGVDYVGDPRQFAKEFGEDLAVIAFAVDAFGLPSNLKLSVHSGSDKFSIYPCMQQAIRQYDAGLHVKTAGTTWLEELIGLASAGPEGLSVARDVYRGALSRFEELCGPYATVIDIDRTQLPSPDEVDTWDGVRFADALRHDASHPAYNLHVRQLLHVGYKVAAEMGDRFTDALARFEDAVGENVTDNILERHIRPIFVAT